jgi:hypothetical protein
MLLLATSGMEEDRATAIDVGLAQGEVELAASGGGVATWWMCCWCFPMVMASDGAARGRGQAAEEKAGAARRRETRRSAAGKTGARPGEKRLLTGDKKWGKKGPTFQIRKIGKR